MQQVNLYQPVFRKEHKLLSFKALVQAAGLFALGLSLLHAYGLRQSAALEARLNRLEAARAQAEARLARLPTALEDAGDGELARREAELAARRAVLARLQALESAPRRGAAEFMEALARQVVEGLWLTGFVLDLEHDALELEGGALRPELVPAYVQRLGREPAVRGARFGHLVLSRDEERRDRVRFQLRTGGPEAAP